MKIDLPERLAIELNKIDWRKVQDQDLNLIIKIGVPLLERKGYLKTNEGNNQNEPSKKNS